MNSEEFRKEVHTFIDAELDKFEDYQTIAADILKEFDRVCRKNNLSYWAAFGTLLGIKRDGGQIPWDYDIDILAPFSELDNLRKALKNDLGADYYYVFTDTMPNYPTNCLRVCRKGYDWKAIHVDVFFLIGVPEDKKERDLFIKKCIKYKKIRHAKYMQDHFPSEGVSFVDRLIKWLQRNRYFYFTSKKLNAIQRKLCSQYSLEECPNWNGYGGPIILPRGIFEKSEASFHNFPVIIPSKYDEFLSLFYDEWRSYQPISIRFNEFYKMKNIVDSRQLKYQKDKNDN